jgi:hypothetical protein
MDNPSRQQPNAPNSSTQILIMKFRSLLLAVMPVLLLGQFSSAQEEEDKKLAVRALLLAPGGPTMELHTIASESKKLAGPVLVGARGLSDPISPGARNFSFAVPDDSKEDGYRPIAQVVLPARGSEFIILLEPVGKIIKSHVINGKSPDFVNDSTLFFNATDIPIGAELGKKKLLIPPRKPTIVPAPRREGEQPWYGVAFYESKDGRASLFSSARWPYRNASRSYLFFYRVAPSGKIAYEAVDEPLKL